MLLTLIRSAKILTLAFVGALALFCGCHRATHASRDASGDATGAGDAPDVAAPDAAAELGGSDTAAVDAALDAVDAADAARADAAPDAAPEAATDGQTSDVSSGPTPLRALSISVGRYHTCALLETHGIKCWGSSLSGEVGLGDTKDRGNTAAEMGDALPFVDLGTGRTAKAVSAGYYATCAILDTDDVKCWGWSGRTTAPSNTPKGMNRGDEPGEMGDALPIVDLGAGHKAKRVAVGYYGVCVQRDDDSFLCWLGETSFTTTPARAGHAVVDLQPGSHVLALYDDGKVFDLLYGAASDQKLDVRAPAVGVAGSSMNACAALQGGGAACLIPAKALEASKGTLRGLALPESTNSTQCALRADGRVSCFGITSAEWSETVDEDGALVVALGQPASAIAGGGEFNACAILADGRVKCWPWGAKALASAPWVEAGSTPDGTYKGRWLPLDLGTLSAK